MWPPRSHREWLDRIRSDPGVLQADVAGLALDMLILLTEDEILFTQGA